MHETFDIYDNFISLTPLMSLKPRKLDGDDRE